MISEPNEIIEKYLLGELKGKALRDFETEMLNSPQLASEVELLKDIIHSINEKDIIDLRANLKAISNENVTQTSEQVFFDLAQNLTINSSQAFSSAITSSESSLQQIHIENHKKAMNERIHKISLTTDQEQELLLNKQISDFSFWEEVKEAVLEKDIIDLRNNLNEITSQGQLYFTDYEIDEYLSNEMQPDQADEFEKMMLNNKVLYDHVQLHRDIDRAVQENDIIKLRDSLNSIVEKEQQVEPAEVRRIDEYLLNYLDESERIDFESHLAENVKLEEEVKLNSEINEAIGEQDIMKIRASLSEIINENKESTKIRKFVPDNFREHPFRLIGAAASISAIISAGFLNLNHENMNAEKLYRQVYHPYEATGLFRSATIVNPAINGVDLYNAHRYDEALLQFSTVLKENCEHPMSNFFTGLCYMEKNQFEKAIGSFQNVIDEKDNLFIEQAQWYMALSYLGCNKEKDAYSLLNGIIDNKGYYKKEAKDLLKRLK
jgi:hypothetical protein